MTDQQMLQELIELAVKHGWESPFGLAEAGVPCEAHSVESEGTCISTLLFNHDFAKAVFGEMEVDWLGMTELENLEWQEKSYDHALGKNPPEWQLPFVATPFESEKERWEYFLPKLALTDEEKRIEYAYEHRRRD